ncbi:hypothetical protein F4779DRAFT_594241 [Xylariaceae sp. FL0662B]|nr:hypothetical protein F4779DRAFT_594241 [Xylariaceae sp. FL0662B]
MASDPAESTASQAGHDSTVFTLQVISPSLGVPQPLALHELPANLTVRQLKERIRNVIPTRPTEQAQRLIHRGRLLARDTETLQQVFGEEALRSAEYQTLHLVLRDLSDGRTSSTPTPTIHASNQPPAPGQQPPGIHVHTQPHQQQHHHHHHTNQFHPQPQVRIGATPFSSVAFAFPQGHTLGASTSQTFGAPTGLTPQQYSQWVQAMNAHTGILNQNQRDRGTQGANTPGRTASPFQPGATRTVVREGIGPNGAQWRITVNESVSNPLQQPGRTGSPFSAANVPNLWGSQPRSVPNGGQLSGNDVQNILRTADAGPATRVMTDAMRRNASTSSLSNLASSQAHHPIPPSVTTPLIPSRTGSAAGTPDPLRAASHSRNVPRSQSQPQSSTGSPEVYILSSPSGPRALLLHGNLETYFSPQLRVQNQPMGVALPQWPFSTTLAFNQQHVVPPPNPQLLTRPLGGRHDVPNPPASNTPQPQQPQGQVQQGLPHPPHVLPQIGHAMARADHPQVQAVRIAQLWPHISMIIRLGVFIWWFTSPTSSWARWITVISIAIAFFLINTGLLAPVVEQFWVPLRRHLEGLLPNADGHRHRGRPHERARNAQGANGEAADAGQHREPNPADTAARLVQQRREVNANWLMNQVRRLERAGILFLASIAPGVAERHIAQMERDQAERRRREAEAEAAAAAAAQAENRDGSEGADQTTENGGSASNGDSGSQAQPAGDEGGNRRPAAADEPLIAI